MLGSICQESLCSHGMYRSRSQVSLFVPKQAEFLHNFPQGLFPGDPNTWHPQSHISNLLSVSKWKNLLLFVWHSGPSTVGLAFLGGQVCEGVRAWRTGAWVKRLGLVGLFLPGKCSRQAKHFFSCFLVCEGYHVCQLLAQCCVVYREEFSGHYSWGLLPSNWEN